MVVYELLHILRSIELLKRYISKEVELVVPLKQAAVEDWKING